MITGSLRELDLHQAEQTQPKYERLKSHLLAELTAGRLKPGEALPSEASLVNTLGVARNTVRQALAELESDGLICRVQGKGTFVDEHVRRRLRRGLDAFALLTPDTRSGGYPSLLHGFEAACKESRNQVFVCNTENDVKVQSDIILQLMDKDVAGVALVPATEPLTPAYQVRQLQQKGIPVVFCHRRMEGVRAPLLAIPAYQVGRLAGEALVKHGHRRVAFLTSYRATSTQAYEDGLREAMRAGGGDLPQQFVCFGNSTTDMHELEQQFWKQLQRMFGAADRPTAIFTTFDPLAELIYLLLGRLGLKIPENISLISAGGPWRQGAITRLLTSVVVEEVEIGRRAAQLLQEMREGDRPLDDDEEIVIPLGWAEGQTLGPAYGSYGNSNEGDRR